MRKFITTAMLLILAVPSFCQETEEDAVTKAGLVFVDSFYWDNYSIRAMQKDSTDTYHLFLGLSNDRDGNINIRYLHIFPDDYPQFYSCFCQVRDKFSDWARTAAENGVKDFKKQIPVDFEETVYRISFLGPGGNLSTDFVATFSVDSEGHSCLMLGTREDEDYFYTYGSPEMFATLVDLVGLDNIRKKYDAYLQRKARREKAETDRNALFN